MFYGDLYPNDECYDERIAKRLDQLLKARKQFAYGQTTDYFRYHNCIGFVRSGDEHHPGCAVVLRTCAKQRYVHMNRAVHRALCVLDCLKVPNADKSEIAPATYKLCLSMLTHLPTAIKQSMLG